MDRSFRKAEQAFKHEPTAENLIRFWSACVRISHPLQLELLQSEHSCNSEIENILTQNNDLVAYRELDFRQLQRLVMLQIHRYIADEFTDDIADKAEIYYFGWLPQLFDLNNSGDEFIRDQIYANGVFTLVGYPINPEVTRMEGYYSSIFYLDRATYMPVIHLTTDIESIVHEGREELFRLQDNSCITNDSIKPKPKLVGRRYRQPIGMLLSLNELFQKNENLYIPLIEVMYSPFNRQYTAQFRQGE